MMELITREEELLPELKIHEYEGPFGPAIHHSYVIELFLDPRRAARVNEQYRYKVQAVSEAMRDNKWETFVYLHERPYRVMALRVALDSPRSDAHKLVKMMWTDSENIHQNKHLWLGIWRNLGNPRGVMNANERHVYDSMPETITIHRGIRNRTFWPRGMSWTRDKERAVWFAHRFATKQEIPTVLTATVRKQSVLAYINSRSEEEVVVLPRSLRNVTADERSVS